MFEGHKYTRYPESRCRGNREYYRRWIDRRTVVFLHRIVWEKANGRPVPDGFHVHHANENTADNDPSNLVLVSSAEHSRIHHKGKCSKHQLSHIRRVQKLSCAWHATPEGRSFHRKAVRAQLANLQPVEVVCAHCGDKRTIKPMGRHGKGIRFCSAKCRKLSGIDRETRTCRVCGSLFDSLDKYRRTTVCSRKCIAELSRQARPG